MNNNEHERRHVRHYYRHKHHFWHKYRHAWSMYEQHSRRNILLISGLVVIAYILVIGAVHVLGGYLEYKAPIPETRGNLDERFSPLPSLGYNEEE